MVVMEFWSLLTPCSSMLPCPSWVGSHSPLGLTWSHHYSFAMNFPLKTDFATFHKLYVAFVLPLSQDIFKQPLFVCLAAPGLIWVCGVFHSSHGLLAAECGLSHWSVGLVVLRMWDLRSLTREQTHVPCIARWLPNCWTTSGVPNILNSWALISSMTHGVQ